MASRHKLNTTVNIYNTTDKVIRDKQVSTLLDLFIREFLTNEVDALTNKRYNQNPLNKEDNKI